MTIAAVPGLQAVTGVEQCAPCHREIAESFAKTGMGRSFCRVRPGAMPEDFRTKNRFGHDLSEREYAMVERGGRYFQRRWQKGADESEIRRPAPRNRH